MKFIQQKPDYSCPLAVPRERVVQCPYPVTFLRYRYPHHAAPSGYDRICDFVDAKTLELPQHLYLAGETILRPWTVWKARTCGVFEHSRYDCIQEEALIRHAKKSPPRIYHFFYGEKLFLRSGPLLSSLGHKVLLTLHHPETNVNAFIQDYSHFEYASKILTMDATMPEFWNKAVGRNISEWMPHGVDCDYFRPVERAVSDTKTIIFAGTHARDIETLVKTIQSLDSVPRLRFRLLSRDETLESLASQNPNVEVIKWLDDAGYKKFISEADLLLLPLKMSTVCNVVLEAMACGVPVVTSAGGIADYLESQSSKIIDSSSEATWVEAIAELLDRGKNARSKARLQALKFDWPAVASRHIKIFEEMLSA